jgi:hypothetical protein
MTGAFASGTLYFLCNRKKTADTNEIVINWVIPVLLLLCALWIVLWRINGVPMTVCKKLLKFLFAWGNFMKFIVKPMLLV